MSEFAAALPKEIKIVVENNQQQKHSPLIAFSQALALFNCYTCLDETRVEQVK